MAGATPIGEWWMAHLVVEVELLPRALKTGGVRAAISLSSLVVTSGRCSSTGGDLCPHRFDAIREGFNQNRIGCYAQGFQGYCNVLDHLCSVCARVLKDCHGFGGYVQGFQG